MNPTFFLSPGTPGKLIWGAGPAFVIPTATSTILGQGKLSMGPTVVLLTQPPHWTLGTFSSTMCGRSQGRNTANWRAGSGNVWTVPVGGGVGKIMKLGFQPINWQAEFYGNAVHTSGGSSWIMRMQIAFLFPKLSPEDEKMPMEKQLKKLEQQQ